ncbi:MAG: hypothetical protein EOP83_20710, partial [Verrucomicrobiaceae bacterium]
MNLKNPSVLRCLAASLLLAMGDHAHGAWTKFEDFEIGFTANATVSGIHGWVADAPASATATLDPAASGRGLVCRAQPGGRNDIYRPLGAMEIPNGTTATVFFEAFIPTAGAGDENISIGLSDVAAPNDYGAYEPQFRWSNADIFPRNGTAFMDTGYNHKTGEWMQVWLVVNNATDTVDMHVQSPTGSTTRVKVANDFGFRNGVAANALVSFMLIQSAGQDIYIDNIYVANGSVDLTFPPIPGTLPTVVADAIETGVGAAITFDPLANDTGRIDQTSLQIITAPTSGTAVIEGGKIRYRHTGSTTGTDRFRYRIANPEGAEHSEGNVTVNISSSFRLANVTANVPADPPAAAAGGLAIIDGLPGLTFPDAVAMTSVPGKPEALLVASVNGSIWYVPDSTAAVPVKQQVLNVASLSNFTRGRSIYSIECFPDFATTGHIIVNYQGDSSRLPAPGPGQTVQDVMVNLDKNGAPDSIIECDLRVSRFTLSPDHLVSAVDGLSPNRIRVG